jgi:hypothetical protein
MDTSEFFNTVVKPNYEEFTRKPDDFSVLWNAIISMHTVAEFLALDQLEYADVSRRKLGETANQIRKNDQRLKDLKSCAETLKHVRNIPSAPKQKSNTVALSSTNPTLTISSTTVSSMDRTTWTIGPYDLVGVAHQAFAALSALVR